MKLNEVADRTQSRRTIAMYHEPFLKEQARRLAWLSLQCVLLPMSILTALVYNLPIVNRSGIASTRRTFPRLRLLRPFAFSQNVFRNAQLR